MVSVTDESSGITVCIPSIPPRGALFDRALASVQIALAKLHKIDVYGDVSVAVDHTRQGAAVTRDLAMSWARTKWVAFLDDDDEMDPGHLVALWTAAQETGVDYLWSRFRLGLQIGANIEFRDGPSPLGRGTFEQWNDEQPAQTTVTTMVRTELAKSVGGFSGQYALPGDQIDGQRAGEDWLFTLACRAAGGKFHHVPEVTWTWHHHDKNTSGLPDRW